MSFRPVCASDCDVRGPIMQVKNAAGQWVSAEPIPGTLVCNIGDMLRVWTHGLYKVTRSPLAGLQQARLVGHSVGRARHVLGDRPPLAGL